MFLRKIRAALAVLAVMAFVSSAQGAGSSSNTMVVSLTSSSTGQIIALFTNYIPGRPQCAASTNEMVFDGNTNGGRIMLELLTTAMVQRKYVDIVGTNGCTGPREQLSVVTIK